MTNKPVAKTGDIRKALAKYLSKNLTCDKDITMDVWEYEADRILPIIQPLIAAAELRGAEKERDKVTAEEEESREAGEFIQIINRYEDGE